LHSQGIVLLEQSSVAHRYKRPLHEQLLSTDMSWPCREEGGIRDLLGDSTVFASAMLFYSGDSGITAAS